MGPGFPGLFTFEYISLLSQALGTTVAAQLSQTGLITKQEISNKDSFGPIGTLTRLAELDWTLVT